MFVLEKAVYFLTFPTSFILFLIMEVTINEHNANQRCDRFLRKYCKIYPDIRLSDIYSRIRKKQVLVNNKKVAEDYRLSIWDVVSFDDALLWKKDMSLLISPKERKLKKLTLDEITPRILYEDNHRLVFNKPADTVIHPSNQHWNDLCMNDYLERYLKTTWAWTKEQQESWFIPSFWYRLDKDTSWVLIAAKTYEALQYLNETIRERNIEKEYFTFVVWEFPQYKKIDKPLEKSYDPKFDRAHVKINSKDWVEAVTECWKEKIIYHPVLWQISLVKVKIHTWRMHQIRVHLSDAGYPVLWDIVYGNPVVNRKLYKQLNINRQLLHCSMYSYKDIGSWKTLRFVAPLPEDFQSLLWK